MDGSLIVALKLEWLLSGALFNACMRPGAAGSQPLTAGFRTTAVLQKLPEGQFTLLGQSGRSGAEPAMAAVVCLPAIDW